MASLSFCPWNFLTYSPCQLDGEDFKRRSRLCTGSICSKRPSRYSHAPLLDLCVRQLSAAVNVADFDHDIRTTNPLKYSSIKTLNEVHGTLVLYLWNTSLMHPSSTTDIGEVWANMLHNVYAALVTAHGWSATARTDPTGTEGNVVYLHLFLDALPLQPCNPTRTRNYLDPASTRY